MAFALDGGEEPQQSRTVKHMGLVIAAVKVVNEKLKVSGCRADQWMAINAGHRGQQVPGFNVIEPGIMVLPFCFVITRALQIPQTIMPNRGFRPHIEARQLPATSILKNRT